MGDLACTTVAALVPEGWHITICDERIEPVNMDINADVIGITGKVSQRTRMFELAKEFMSRGRLVMIGGPYASLNPDEFQDKCDILVCGEMEEIASEVFADIEADKWRSLYKGSLVDLSNSPVPRWDLYPARRSMAAVVQTSRGCPFQCEFCDVIAYVGRKQRHKPVDLVLRELDNIYRLGYRSVFLADDNFTVYRRRARELLTALIEWNRKPGHRPVSFATQLSLDAARDPDLLDLCAKAGLRNVFIGIETPNAESLLLTKKRQNVGVDIVGEVEKFLSHGIGVIGGIIVGFDADEPDIFDIQERFIESMPVPIVTIGTLVAPPQTPLYEKLAKAGRLHGDDDLGAGDVFQTNIVPLKMTQDELLNGVQRLCRRVYDPVAFEQRMQHFMRSCRSLAPPGRNASGPIRIGPMKQAMINRFSSIGPEERKLVTRFVATAANYPADVQSLAFQYLIRYIQVRYVYHFNKMWTFPASPAAAVSEYA